MAAQVWRKSLRGTLHSQRGELKRVIAGGEGGILTHPISIKFNYVNN